MSRDRPRSWRILSSAYPIVTRFLRLRSDRVELPSGAIVEDYFVRESLGFSVVLALTPDEQVILVRQYKHGIGEVVTELPAGGIDPGETPEECATRELREETGYEGSAPVHIRSFITDPTNSNSRYHLFVIAEAVRVGEPAPDLTEEIDVVLVSLDELRAMAFDGRIAAGTQVAAALVGLDALGR